MSTKPGLPKGTRDFGPEEVNKRKYIFGIIESVFRKYGYQPLETPVMENLSTLTGKYGEEGDRLLFKVLNNGDYLQKADEEALTSRNSSKLTSSISKRGLRYDLTIPFARYVVMNQHKIAFPFKRYQIQPVWRADRPQKGRYQEFYQCDVDVIGSEALIYEAEQLQIYDEVFRNLGISVSIKLNNRKILFGIAEKVGISNLFVEMSTAIDKLDKIGVDKVLDDLENRGIPREKGREVLVLIETEDIKTMKEKLLGTQGEDGCNEVMTVLSLLDTTVSMAQVKFDPALARGLNYYTGCIMEVTSPQSEVGSLGGGGRYDELTGVFGLKGVSGVGVSFGAARIYDVMNDRNMFPSNVTSHLDILLVTMDDDGFRFGIDILKELRKEDIKSDIYPSPVKMAKQMKYADAVRVPYVGIIGSEEVSNKVISLKNMESGMQEKLALDEVIKFLKETSI